MSSDSKLQEVTRKISNVESKIADEKRGLSKIESKLDEVKTEHDRAAGKLRELEQELGRLLEDKHRAEDAVKADAAREQKRSA
ncbi:hypothetical protein K2Q16_01680 [Patescibacteria group bacterium]|nr:hypothetical protein [Patescibacteria group bacterium]